MRHLKVHVGQADMNIDNRETSALLGSIKTYVSVFFVVGVLCWLL